MYTPIQVVDFIIRSVEDVLQNEFNASLADKGVQILDPFTGTGTFITRLLQKGIIPPENYHKNIMKFTPMKLSYSLITLRQLTLKVFITRYLQKITKIQPLTNLSMVSV